MKILRITATIDPKSGGVVESILQMARAAKTLGHIVEVVCIDDPDAAFLKNLDITVHAVGRGILNYRLQPQLSGWLYRNASHYDAVIIDGIWQFHSVAAHHVLTRLHIPYHVFTHGMLAPWFKHTHPLKHLKKWLYWRMGDYRVLRDARAVLFTSEEERVGARQTFALYQATEKVIALGAQGPNVDLTIARADFLQAFPPLSGKRIILCLCRIHPIKGVDLLIQAFAQTLQDDDEYRLVVAGPGDAAYVKTLQDLAVSLNVADKIIWTGLLNEQKKWSAFAAAEVFALVSHHENFGMVIAEALACGKPVLISDKVNIWREIAGDNAGFVEEDSLEGAVRLFQRYRQLNDAGRERMSQAALQCFASHFEIATAAQGLVDAIADKSVQ